MQIQNPELAIVTVAGPADEKYVRLNIEAIKKRNPQVDLPIYVIDNGKLAVRPNGIKEALDAIVLDGVAQNKNLPAHYRGSYQHADALNNFFKTQKITQRYVLVIDPDFYVLRNSWVNEVISYMQSEDLAFFGAPWHPRWYSKYRYFLCVHFMCIDTKKIDVATLDFSPDLPIKESLASKRKSLPMRVVQFFYFMTLQRSIIGKAKDTGYNIFKQYYMKSKVGLLVPVMAVKLNFVQARVLHFSLGRMLEYILPERFSYLPKKNGYYTGDGFTKFNLPNLSALGWEEFMWKGEPFGFHLRRFLRKNRDIEAEVEQIKQVI